MKNCDYACTVSNQHSAPGLRRGTYSQKVRSTGYPPSTVIMARGAGRIQASGEKVSRGSKRWSLRLVAAENQPSPITLHDDLFLTHLVSPNRRSISTAALVRQKSRCCRHGVHVRAAPERHPVPGRPEDLWLRYPRSERFVPVAVPAARKHADSLQFWLLRPLQMSSRPLSAPAASTR